MDEKREHPRISLDLIAFYHVDGDHQTVKEATVINLSLGGFCFFANNEIPTEEDIRLSIDLEDNQRIHLSVKAMWCNEIGDTGRYRVGVGISDTKSDDYKIFARFCRKFEVDLENSS